jgi:hypothetical protein
MLISWPIAVAIIVGYSIGFVISKLRSNFMEAATTDFYKDYKYLSDTNKMSNDEKEALVAGLDAGKSYSGYFSAWTKIATYKCPSKFYTGMKLAHDCTTSLKPK